METPVFRSEPKDGREGLTYVCGCPCTPTAAPAEDGAAGMEHCCCGKVHFVGRGAESALSAYLADRKATRKREPEYDRGLATVALAGAPTEVAWAFPRE
ncbi:MAG: hypothetical protein U0547_13585 [Dehalococcoidia bacterium]